VNETGSSMGLARVNGEHALKHVNGEHGNVDSKISRRVMGEHNIMDSKSVVGGQ